MGKTILTPKQFDFLEFVVREPSITKRFYFTGGTPLSEFYLKHRLSEDIDLFFIIKKYSYPLEKLIIDAKTKFDWHIDRLNLASQFLRVKEIKNSEMPRMLVPFDRSEMEEFFLKEAKKLGRQILK